MPLTWWKKNERADDKPADKDKVQAPKDVVGRLEESGFVVQKDNSPAPTGKAKVKPGKP